MPTASNAKTSVFPNRFEVQRPFPLSAFARSAAGAGIHNASSRAFSGWSLPYLNRISSCVEATLHPSCARTHDHFAHRRLIRESQLSARWTFKLIEAVRQTRDRVITINRRAAHQAMRASLLHQTACCINKQTRPEKWESTDERAVTGAMSHRRSLRGSPVDDTFEMRCRAQYRVECRDIAKNHSCHCIVVPGEHLAHSPTRSQRKSARPRHLKP